MRCITVFFVLLAWFTSFTAAADQVNLLKITHGIQMDQCRHSQGCDAAKIKRCEQVTKTAFEKCDHFMTNTSPNSEHWSACVNNYLSGQLGADTVLEFMMSPACADSGAKPANAHSITKQIAPQYFVINTADITKPHLMPTPISACRYGAEQQMAQLKKATPQVSFHIEIDDARKTHMIAGEGEEMYNHIFDETTYTYGECIGRAETTFLKDYMGSKAGEVIRTPYTADIYVVVHCSGQPKNALCD